MGIIIISPFWKNRKFYVLNAYLPISKLSVTITNVVVGILFSGLNILTFNWLRFRTSASFCCLWWRVEMKSHFNNMKGFSDSTSEDHDWAKVTDHPNKYLLISACIDGVLIFSLMHCVVFMTLCFPFWDLQFYKP